VGVVSDVMLNWYDPESRPILYLADTQQPARTTTAILRTRVDPLSVARQVRAAVAQLDDRQPIAELEPLTATIADSLSPVRIIERLLLIAAALASALAAIGIYGVLAQWVGARRHEFGVRIALGATHGSIARLVVHETIVTSSVGIVGGVTMAAGVVRLAGGAFLGVPSLDAPTALFVAIGAMGLAVAAALGPARRAAGVNVAELLRLD
jgi:ABC-type antimicrobial peptide transport system permease subunit